MENLLKPENKDKLISVLTYHVMPGKAMAADVMKLDGQSVKTVQGSKAMISVANGSVMVEWH